MISFAAISPNSPLLIPNVAKEKQDKLKITIDSMEDLKKKLEAQELDILFLISSHSKMHHDAFGILLAEKYKADFREFGDFETKLQFSADLQLTEKIRHEALDNDFSLTLIHQEDVDYSFGTPLFYLNKESKIKIIPFVHSFDSIKQHYELGRNIKRVLTESKKRIGIIACGGLSQRSNEQSPLGMAPEGKEFNEKFIERIETKNTAGILRFDDELVEKAEESIILPTAVLLGIVDKINYKPQTFSFEAPFGAGQLVCNFKLL